ncbi:MAG TPA: IclR family transcriptional regulator, partial [Caulobacteraceae bacterium]
SRVAAVLRALEGQQAGLSLGQIAKATGLPRATVQRIVDALEVEQFVAADPINGGVGLGAALIRIAGSVHTDFKALARLHLESLCRRVHETIVLTAHRHGRLVLVDQVLPDRAVQIVINPALEIDRYFSATGKAHLAAMAPEELESWMPARLEPPTRHAVPTVAALRRQLEEIRRDGVAYDREERTEGSCALATTIQNTDGVVYAVSLITTSSQFAAQADEFRRELLAARAAIEHSLGGCAPDEPLPQARSAAG